MIVEVTMPVLGLTMDAGTIAGWLKDVGDLIAEGEALFMVETDKAVSDAPAPAGGILARIVAEEGEKLPVGALVAYIAENESDIASLPAPGQSAKTLSAPVLSPAATAQSPVPSARPGSGAPDIPDDGQRVFASPRAKARARELGVELSSLGPQGQRIVESDVIPTTAARPLTQVRRITAERMTLSATSIPQVTYTVRSDVTEALELRKSLRAKGAVQNVALPLDALFVRAAALALRDHPEVNSQWVEGQGIRIMPTINIGVAVAVEGRGLMVPVVQNAGSLSLSAIATEVARLLEGAGAGTLGPDDYAGGTFTIFSLAAFGVESFTPLVNPPQVAILGIGAVVATPVYKRGALVKRRLLVLALTTDHRVLDGAPSARFLRRVQNLIEQPSSLL